MVEKEEEAKTEQVEEDKDVEITLDENAEPASDAAGESEPDSGLSESKSEEPDDKELQDVGKRAQDRIKKLSDQGKVPKAKALGSFISFFFASTNHFSNNSNGSSRSKKHLLSPNEFF